jgi:RNA polymerase sigma factor (sigma-70 family)
MAMAALSSAVMHRVAGRRSGSRAAIRAKALDEYSDSELMTVIADGDMGALGELYDRFAPIAFGLALRVLGDRGLAEDAVQDAFLSVWRSAESFDGRQGSARSWTLMLVHRRAVDLVRRNQRLVPQDSPEPTDPVGPSHAECTALDAARRSVQAALASLPAKQRKVLDLAYYGGYTQQEIATSLRIPIGTVKSQTFQALRRLQLLLAPAGNLPD